MPIPTGGKKGDVDTSQLSAYAVYNNLVPGVKAYVDTSESTQASKRKKSKKKANKKAAAEAIVKGELSKMIEETSSAPVTNGQSPSKENGQTPEAGKKKKDTLKQKGPKEPEAAVVLDLKAQKAARRKESKQRRKSLKASTNGEQEVQQKQKDTTPSPSTNLDESLTESKSSKRKKHRKLKAEAAAMASQVQAEAEEAPPKKLRKLNKEPEYLPNPLAIRNKIDSVKKANVQTPEATPSKKKNKGQADGNETSPKKSIVVAPITPKSNKKPKNAAKAAVGEEAEPELTVVPHKKNKKNKSAEETEELVEVAPTQFEDSADLPNVFDVINSKPIQDSVAHGEALVKWLIHPFPLALFKSEHWEQKPLYVRRKDVFPEYYEWILSTAALDDMLRKNALKYSENLDITAYENGVRETISKEMTGRARPAAVWDYYSTGHSIRILNPQTYCKPLWRLNASLQEWFGCFVGANVYLTPPDSQGFAPHYDDIEAFILQVEGKKHWKLYKPRSENTKLPQFSSKDFKEEDLGKPDMEFILEEGDILYFPRGWIHQASTVDGHHSMHITLSCYQQNTWADLLKQHFIKSLEKLTANDIDFRRGLPIDYMSFMGMAHSKNRDKSIISKRKEFKQTLTTLVEKVMHVEADPAADEMGKKFIWDSLPPYITRKEKDITVNDDGEFLNHGRVKNRVEMDPDVEVKLLRKNCIRMITEENTLRLYFSIENSLVYHVEEPQFLEVPDEFRPAIEYLIKKYPEFTRIEDLPMKSNDVTKKIQLVSDFWERGILMTKKPLEAGEIDEEDFEFDANSDDEMLDETDEDNAETETDDSCSDDDEDESDDDSFIDDSFADAMNGEPISDDDEDNSSVDGIVEDLDNSNAEEGSDDDDDVEILDLQEMAEELDEDDFEESD